MGSRKVKAVKVGVGKKTISQLTDQQRVFIAELKRDREFSPARAAKEAGYAHPAQAASRLLNDPRIQKALGKALTERLRRCEIDAEKVLRELAFIGFSDPLDMFDANGNLRPLKDMPVYARKAIASFEVETRRGKEDEDGNCEETTTVKVKLWPKNNALELIAKHLGMLDERLKVDHGLSEAGASLLKGILERVATKPTRIIDADYITKVASEDTPSN